MPDPALASEHRPPGLSTPDGGGRAGWVPAAESLAGGLPVRILRADQVPIWPWWNRRQNGDGFWRLYRHDCDGAWLGRCGGGTTALPAGRAVVVPAGTAFTCHAAPGVCQFYVHFTVMLPEALVRGCFPRPFALRPDAQLDGLLAALARGWGAARRGPGLLLRLQAAVQLALAQVLEGLPADQAASLHAMLAGTHPLAGLQAFVREHLREPLSVADLVSLTGLPRNRLSRLCREQLGASPAQIIVRERLAAAEDLLAHSAQGLDGIAAVCGFGTRFYLSRVFARRHGCGPATWRMRMQTRRDDGVVGT